MKSFLRAMCGGALILSLSLSARAEEVAAPKGEVLLTLSGSLEQTNVDGTLQLDQAMLEALPQTEFTTSTTWTSGTPTFKGVLLKDLIAAVGAKGGTVTLQAVNDYAVTMPLADVGPEAPLLAFLMDGETMSLRDKGPIWMVYPYDSNEKFRTEETYSRSIWQLTQIIFAD
ncbi:molybdopterin-dependent oxidoreductase [Stagnihabitans tardus]|uniref:Molybdopterin-dependent oxidoreductase n=1 Tax=Stagnihabitans tardus TaxID=2699202 RepID=A0AAE5BTZ8_9RHOB|nr:molybdopterin-dependent oxidoreductase [Stagnihabitans tardus]NBZ89630.1 molybdopterin-dependent oxidoreductase [Stagnihabitans tardus]